MGATKHVTFYQRCSLFWNSPRQPGSGAPARPLRAHILAASDPRALAPSPRAHATSRPSTRAPVRPRALARTCTHARPRADPIARNKHTAYTRPTKQPASDVSCARATHATGQVKLIPHHHGRRRICMHGTSTHPPVMHPIMMHSASGRQRLRRRN